MGERIHIWGDRNTNGVEFFRELTEGETWFPYPGGNGIIVCHPDRPPVWCHMDADGPRQDYISGIQAPTEFIPDDPYTPLAHETRRVAAISTAMLSIGSDRPFTATECKQLFEDGIKRLIKRQT